MQRPIRPDWLLRQANELGCRESAAGQPRNADLRRAVSAAYYALFHEFVGRVATHLLPNCDNESRWEFGRRVRHASIRNVCMWLTATSGVPQRVQASVTKLITNTDLVDVATAFQDLYNARERADYDNIADFTKAGTLALIDLATDAIEKLARHEGTVDYERFMAHIATAMEMK